METLLALDHFIFSLFSRIPHPLFLNWLALWLSGIGMGGLVWLLISIILFFREEKRDHWFFLPVVTAAALSELLSNIFLKDLFARNRPPGAGLPDFSFPSGHATVAWAMAVVLAAKEPRAKYFFYFLAVLISLSRVFLGVHYPSDIIAGGLVGITIGLFSLRIERLLSIKYHKKRNYRRRMI